MNHKKLISYSQVASYNSCPKKWEYEYKKELAPRVDFPPLRMGTMVHAFLESALRGNGSLQCEGAVDSTVKSYFASRELFDEEKQATLEQAEMAKKVGLKAAVRLLSEYRPVVWNGTLMIEHAMKLRIDGDVFLVGTLDSVVQNIQTSATWLMDHKIRKQLQPTENEEVNIQMPTYQFMLLEEGLTTVGSISHQVYHEMPKVPKINKNGTVSKTDIRSDWETYQAAVIEAGENPADYYDMAQKLATKEFHRYSTAYRTLTEVKNVFHLITLPTIQRIVEAYDSDEPQTRNMSIWSCIGCKFKDLCLEELRGNDTEYMIKHGFTRNSYLDKYTGKEEEEV